jgi:GcrA cell cycle regulator
MIKKTKKLKTIVDLENSECRWPVGDPRHADFHFCGQRQAVGRPYCEFHWRLSTQPTRPRAEQAATVPATRRAA